MKDELTTTVESKQVCPPDAKPVLSAGFYITDFCNCKCGEEVSPSQADTINQILYDDNRDKVVGFECWKCGDWIVFPKTCR
jgi:hypothetical protein